MAHLQTRVKWWIRPDHIIGYSSYEYQEEKRTGREIWVMIRETTQSHISKKAKRWIRTEEPCTLEKRIMFVEVWTNTAPPHPNPLFINLSLPFDRWWLRIQNQWYVAHILSGWKSLEPLPMILQLLWSLCSTHCKLIVTFLIWLDITQDYKESCLEEDLVQKSLSILLFPTNSVPYWLLHNY